MSSIKRYLSKHDTSLASSLRLSSISLILCLHQQLASEPVIKIICQESENSHTEVSVLKSMFVISFIFLKPINNLRGLIDRTGKQITTDWKNLFSSV